MIMRQKRISEFGTQQLLLDTYSVKTLLVHLHHLGEGSSGSGGAGIGAGGVGSGSETTRSPIPAMYLKLVAGKISHIEVVLKLLGTPEELLVERFKSMWPEGNSNDLMGLMEKRGMKRPEQQGLLEVLKLRGGDVAKGGLASVVNTTVLSLGNAGQTLGMASMGMKWK